MTAISPVVKPVSQMRLSPGSAVTIEDVTWEEFESILLELGEKLFTKQWTEPDN
ncbi:MULTISPECIES: hypothetical protein [Nostocales]|uniref:hypothetical protein n=1 Tax=Nostocales TaxID=1161 RepID=UPI0004BB9E6B|nr:MULTISPECIES: hypothetical protein [Nostocales]